MKKYLDEIKNIQVNFIEFLESSENDEENFQNLILIFEDFKMQENKSNVRLFLLFISNICSNFFFIKKVWKLLFSRQTVFIL